MNSHILCHACRWGAAPGLLTRCARPDLPPLSALTDADTAPHGGAGAGENPTAYALPALTAVNGACAYFEPRPGVE